MTTVIFSGCDESVGKSTTVIGTDDILQEFRAVLEIPRSGELYPNEINAYIAERVYEMGYEAKTDDAGNVIVDIPASPGAEDLPLTILQCHTDDEIAVSKDMLFNASTDGVRADLYREDGVIQANGTSMGASSAMGIASILNVLRATQAHGPLRAIFTSGRNGDMSGAKNLAAEYLNGDRLISLNGDKLGTVNFGSPYALTLNSDRDLTDTETQGRHAYVIAAAGFPEHKASLHTDDDEEPINPLTIITEVLANAKSAGVFYELCALSGQADGLCAPTEATAVVVVNDYERRKFLQIFDAVEKEYRNEAERHDAEIVMIETVLPERAVSNDDAGNVLTFLFGMSTGNFSSDEENPARLYINRVNLTPQHFSCEILIQGTDEKAVGKIVAEQNNIEKLSFIPVLETGRIPGFSTESDEAFALRLFESYENAIESDCTFVAGPIVNELGYLREKNPDLKILSIGVTIDARDTADESIDRDTMAVPANTIFGFLSGEKFLPDA
jgi:dipeptidase D